MGELIPQLIVTGLAAAVSPVAVMVLVAVMLQKNERRNSPLFLLGYTLVLVAIGVAGVFFLKAGGSGTKTHLDDYVNLGLGVLCLALIPYSLFKKQKEGKKEPKDLRASEVVLLGMGTMAVNASTFVIYLAGAHEISKAKLSVANDILALVILTAVTLVTLLVPIAIFFLMPNRSQKMLDRLQAWLAKYRKVIGVGILVIFGVYLLVKGISGIA